MCLSVYDIEEKESVSVCVCMFDRVLECLYVCVRERWCVCMSEREYVCLRVCVRVCMREGESQYD